MRSLPKISFVMPVRNEGAFIERSLGAVLDQDYPAELVEILVADGMSTDDTRARISERAAGRENLRIVDNRGGIVSTGMNAALARARGDVIIRVDGHTIVAPDYARQCVSALERTHADNVGGRMTAVGEGPLANAVAAATSSPFGVGGARFHYSEREEWVDTVYMGAWPRAVFQRIGLFDEEQVRNQDDELNYRLRERGGRIRLCPEIRSKYYNRVSFRSLWRQYFQYGFWKVRVLQKHTRQMRARQFAPPAFVLTLLVAAALAPFFSTAAAAFLGIVALYIAAAFAATVMVASGRAARSVAVVPVVFATLHLAYGLGFLVGLARFWNRWADDEPRWSEPDPAQVDETGQDVRHNCASTGERSG